MRANAYAADMADPWLFPDANPDICLRATVRELLRRFGKRAVREAVENEGRERVRCWKCRSANTELVASQGDGWRVHVCVECGRHITTRA